MDSESDSTQDSSPNTEDTSNKLKWGSDKWIEEREKEAKELQEATVRLGQLVMEAERCQVGHSVHVQLNRGRKEKRRAVIYTSVRAMSNISYLRTVNNWTHNEISVVPARKRPRGCAKRNRAGFVPFYDHQAVSHPEFSLKSNETVDPGEKGDQGV